MATFFNQPSAAYRNFQVVFTILTLNFAIPCLGYLFAPQDVMVQFSALNQFLGGPAYNQPETQSYFWRFLGTANVMALAFMCAMLQSNVRRFQVVVIPLTFLKSTAATLWLVGFLNHPEFRAFLAAAILDYVTSVLFVVFVNSAARSIAALPDDQLVPRPRFVGPA